MQAIKLSIPSQLAQDCQQVVKEGGYINMQALALEGLRRMHQEHLRRKALAWLAQNKGVLPEKKLTSEMKNAAIHELEQALWQHNKNAVPFKVRKISRH